MNDAEILALYWERNENAIRETDAVYGRRLHVLSNRIVNSHEDAQGCVSDTYMKAWQTIPLQRPNCFFAYLARICRNLSLDRLEWWSAEKRSATVVSLTQEMELKVLVAEGTDNQEHLKPGSHVMVQLIEYDRENATIVINVIDAVKLPVNS
jgi:RNA polymerase sigma-70 factor (ECF subfamily)